MVGTRASFFTDLVPQLGWIYQIFVSGISVLSVNWAPAAAAAAKSLQSCSTLCDPIDGSPPGFPVPGILQARILECVAISFSKLGSYFSSKCSLCGTVEKQLQVRTIKSSKSELLCCS